MLENKKKFKVSVKFSSLPEEKKKKIMFEVFDILLIKKNKYGNENNQNKKGIL